MSVLRFCYQAELRVLARNDLMLQLDLTLDTPAANLALDEALLEQAELDSGHEEVLRLWESPSPFVVLGRSSPYQKEVNLDYCRDHSIEVLRRSSGGQTVLAGPGCLMYCLLVSYRKRPELKMLDRAHQFVMTNIQQGLGRAGIATSVRGTSDLAITDRKVSGNSLRCKKSFFIYHGTLLYDLPVELIQNCLNRPVRKPDYRGARDHTEFLTTLPATAEELREILIAAFDADKTMTDWPEALTEHLATEKYSTDAWTQRH